MEKEEFILLNASEEAFHYFTDLLNPSDEPSKRAPRFEFVVDNVGLDIIADLMLATVLTVQGDAGEREIVKEGANATTTTSPIVSEALSESHPAKPHPRVIVHVKGFPVFVSDATRQDFDQMLDAFEEEVGAEEARATGAIDAGVGLDGGLSETIDEELPVAGKEWRRYRYPKLARIAQLWRQFLESGLWQVRSLF
jgi:hypothetical protein